MPFKWVDPQTDINNIINSSEQSKNYSVKSDILLKSLKALIEPCINIATCEYTSIIDKAKIKGNGWVELITITNY